MKITVEELIDYLKNEDQDKVIDFGGLDFYRLKDRGDCIQFEFNQTIYQDKEGNVVVENH